MLLSSIAVTDEGESGVTDRKDTSCRTAVAIICDSGYLVCRQLTLPSANTSNYTCGADERGHRKLQRDLR